MASRSYGGVLAVTVVALGAGAALAFTALQRDASARAGSSIVAADEGIASIGVRNAHQIRPAAADYAAFAREDSLWRAGLPGDAAGVRGIVTTTSAGTWAPSEEQALRDRVFLLVRDGQLAAALRELGGWLERNPRDAGALLEQARLLARIGRNDDASRSYARLLALGDDPAVRREWAAHLLRSARHEEAAREYAALVRRDSLDTELRLGLARALAWGGLPREAERELRWLAERMPGDTTVIAMLRGARAGVDPSAAEAEAWLSGDPAYAPYRVALARALVREGRHREAGAQYDALLAGSPSPALFAEAAGARAAAGDSAGAARLLGRAVAMSPADDSLRLRWAEALAWSGDRAGAIAQYTQLIAREERPELLLARGRLLAWSGRLPAAERDLARSAALRPDYDAFVMLGEVRRWQGRHGPARDAFEAALALRPGDPMVTASLATLAREERMLLAGGVPEDAWSAFGSWAEDNTGFLFLSSGLSRGVSLGRETIVSVSAEQRRISQRSAREAERYVWGWLVEGSAARWIGASLRATVRAGYAKHGVGGDVVTGGAELAASLPGGVRLTASADRAPAYRSLMTLRTIARWREGEAIDAEVLVGNSGTLAIAVPLGRAELSAQVEETRLSDGNRRRAVSVGARMPLGNGFSALYSGSALGYADRTDVYWDPERYTSHGVGIEWSARPTERLSLAARVMPGIGRSTEAIAIPGEGTLQLRTRTVGQVTAGGEVTWRQGNVDVSAAGGYGRGREGGYQSLNGTLRVRLAW